MFSTYTYKKNIFTLLQSQIWRKFTKKFLKILNQTHTLPHNPEFISKYFSNKSTKTPFGGDFLITWLNESFFMMSMISCSLVEKTGYAENGGEKMEIEDEQN